MPETGWAPAPPLAPGEPLTATVPPAAKLPAAGAPLAGARADRPFGRLLEVDPDVPAPLAPGVFALPAIVCAALGLTAAAPVGSRLQAAMTATTMIVCVTSIKLERCGLSIVSPCVGVRAPSATLNHSGPPTGHRTAPLVAARYVRVQCTVSWCMRLARDCGRKLVLVSAQLMLLPMVQCF